MNSFDLASIVLIIGATVLANVAFLIFVKFSQRKLADEIIGEIRQGAQLAISKMRSEDKTNGNRDNHNE